MKGKDTFTFALDAVRLRKVRAALTTLGVIVGIAAIVALMSISQGYQVALTENFETGLSADTLTVTSGRGLFGKQTDPDPFILYLNSTERIQSVAHVEIVTPVMSDSCILLVGEDELRVTLVGVNYTAYQLAYGTFDAIDGEIPQDTSDPIAVIGAGIANPMDMGINWRDAGDTIEISWQGLINNTLEQKNVSLTISGVLPELGGQTGFGLSTAPSDVAIYIPLEYAQQLFESDAVESLIVKVDAQDQETIDYVSDRISSLFSGSVSVTSATFLLDTITGSLSTTQNLLVGIAGISLVVAGIGIMNIMMVSIIERTREIGTIKALGTENRTIMGLFLAEAAIVGFIGSLIGLIAGYSLSFIFAEYGAAILFGSNMPTHRGLGQTVSFIPLLTPDVIFLAVGFGMIVSIVFGIYPAWRASRLPPVEALRSD
ncbi:MAG: ABC transporter permease [Candidatus Thorarchaeota archaeon]|jgi:putative ABC transport system permease protein